MASVLAVLNLILTGCVSKLIKFLIVFFNFMFVLNLILSGCVSKQQRSALPESLLK